MKRFRLPRKIKKKLKGILWLYPADEKGNRLAAFPYRNQQDYSNMKLAIVEDLMKSKNTKAERKAYSNKINREVRVADEELKIFVDTIFAEKFKTSSYDILIKAKNHPKAVIAYYNFINAYNLRQNGQGYENVCCMAVDKAKKMMKK